jgi:Uma2 family endonuclease
MHQSARQFPEQTTVEEFLALPGAGRRELVDGAITSMAPAAPIHGRLQARLTILIGNHLANGASPYWVATEPGVQPRAQARFNVRIPDLGVSCTPERPEDTFLRDPVLLVEILSPSNGKDTSSNVMAYTSIPSVIEVLIVDSTCRAIEHLYRNADGSWPDNPALVGEADPFTPRSIGLTLTMAEVYAGTSLDAGGNT